jgi:amino acid transporter
VLVGEVAGLSGLQAPLAFLAAALMATPTALSFGELAARFPFSAGEAVFVERGLRLAGLPLVVGLMVAFAGMVSAAAISQGFAGYFRVFVDLPPAGLTAALIVLLGVLAVWGIVESVSLAAVLTVAEVGALVMVIAGGADDVLASPEAVAEMLRLPAAALPGILAGGVLAFYAFIGFEDMVNVAEEVREVERNLPRAIIITLLVTTLLYVLVAAVAVTVVAPAELAQSEAPLALVFGRATGWSATPISLVAVFAVVNGALVQIIMASRIFYGLSRLGHLPSVLGRVWRRTRTPVAATAVAAGITMIFALSLPIVRLAEMTSFITLSVFALVNAALIALKRRREAPPQGFRVPAAVPFTGLCVSVAFAVYQCLLWLDLV